MLYHLIGSLRVGSGKVGPHPKLRMNGIYLGNHLEDLFYFAVRICRVYWLIWACVVVGMVKQPSEHSSEFQMSNEDFPALPGAPVR